MVDEAGGSSAALAWSGARASVPSVSAPLADPTAAYLASLSPEGRTTMIERLRAVAALLGVPYEQVVWHEFRFQHVDFLRQRLLEQGRSPATVNLTWPPSGGSPATPGTWGSSRRRSTTASGM